MIVSRASVNGDLQKGPHLPQSFSTKVVIESGLYIAPGSHFSAGRRSIWEVQPGPGSRVGSRTWLDLPDRPSDQPLRPDPGSRVGSRVWPGKWLRTANLARITSRARNRQNRQNLDFSRKLEILVISAISGSGRDSGQIRHPGPICAHGLSSCAHWCPESHPTAYVHCMFGTCIHTLTLHMRYDSLICRINLVTKWYLARFC